MPSHLRFDDEEFEQSDSEDDYTEKDKKLLEKVRNKKRTYSDSEEEVLGVGSDDDEDDDDDQSDLALSDVEGQDHDDGLPNERAWGKDKRKYYSTDYVDADYGGFDGKDAHLAELEEEEAKNLQKQLAQQLDEDDFSLDIFTKKTDEDKKQIEEVIKTDISQLSNRQKIQILQKESPEFFGLIEDFQVKMTIAKDYLNPIMQKYKKGQIANCQAVEFVQTMSELVLNYSTNIYMYLLLKASRVNIENHPIIKRLYQYRQLLSQLNDPFEEIIKPQIDLILQENIVDDNAPRKKKKQLNILSKIAEKTIVLKKIKKTSNDSNDTQPSKKIKLDKTEEMFDNEEEEENINEDELEDQADETEDLGERQKRAITYQMEKNKGLTPHRKKEQRNPRVKHRQKYRKAVIRRKGAVREPRKELTRYGGEISGIKATVSKSIKIKS